MKDLAPPGWTRMPNPVSLSSQAIQALSVGWSASMARLVSVVRNFAVRFPVVVGMDIVRLSVAEAASSAPLDDSISIPGSRIKMPFAAESMPQAHVAMITPWPTAGA